MVSEDPEASRHTNERTNERKNARTHTRTKRMTMGAGALLRQRFVLALRRGETDVINYSLARLLRPKRPTFWSSSFFFAYASYLAPPSHPPHFLPLHHSISRYCTVPIAQSQSSPAQPSALLCNGKSQGEKELERFLWRHTHEIMTNYSSLLPRPHFSFLSLFVALAKWRALSVRCRRCRRQCRRRRLFTWWIACTRKEKKIVTAAAGKVAA